MRKRLLSASGAIFFSALAYLTFLGRGFLDWRYEYPLQDPNGNWVTLGVLFYMALAGVWLWGLLEANNGRRRGWIGRRELGDQLVRGERARRVVRSRRLRRE